MLNNIAHAQTAGAADGGVLGSLVPLVLIIILFYFLLIRPQQKRAKEHREMLAALAVGDEVITGSGIMGKVVEIKGHHVSLNLGDSRVKFQKSAVQSILPKGTLD